jgi:hypothetical protein
MPSPAGIEPSGIDIPLHRPRNPVLELCLAALVVLAVGWSYLHDAALVEGELTSRTPPGYYGLLTEALMQGHLNLNVATDPLLLRLANPYAGAQGAVRPHDMSFYKGKFYVYYGITPALILMVPWKMIAGTYLREIAATAIFCFGGFLLGAVWLVGVRRRVFPQVSPWWTFLALLVMGYGSPTFFLSNNATFYAVPISAAFFCLMAAVLLVDRTVRASTVNRAVAWLAGASLALGLAVGARPHYVVCVGLVLLPAVWIWSQLPPATLGHRPRKRIWLAALLPAALVGIGLALYNYARFDNPLDFGIQYSMASGDLRGAHLMGLESFGSDLHAYLLGKASIVRYYPFVFSRGQPFGVLLHLSLAAAVVLFPITLLRGSLRADPVWSISGFFLLGAALANLAILCTWVLGGVDRYLVDFVPAALLLACGVLFAVVDTAEPWPAAVRWPVIAVMLAAALWTLANGACFGVATRVPTAFRAGLEAVSDRLAYTVERLTGSVQGPLELKVKFPQGAVGRRDPIVTTGNLVGTGDIVFALYPDDSHVQFGFFHLGAGGPVGAPVAVDYKVAHKLTVELGSLYPPRHHPMFDSWSDEQVAELRRHLEVKLDGQSVLRAAADVYPSMPDGVRVGENGLAPDVSAPVFGGEILEQRRLGLPPPPSVAGYPGGPVRLHLRWSPIVGANQPLVSTGHKGAGDLLNVEMLPGGLVRFQHDCWNSSDVVSDPLPTDVKAEHVVDIEMGSLYCNAQQPVPEALRRRLAVWVDGKLAIDMDRPFNPSTPQEVEFGFNSIGGGSSSGMFTGEIIGRESIPARPLSPEKEEWGPLQMTVLFRDAVIGVNEPLLTTGVGAAAKIVYVHYEDRQHARFGFDRAGSGGKLGPSVAVDYSQPHTVEIALGSLFPPEGGPGWDGHAAPPAAERHRLLEVRVDGNVVLQAEEPAATASLREISVGRNYVNTTNCLRTFSGQISGVRRLAW